jgi:hypothetical protein
MMWLKGIRKHDAGGNRLNERDEGMIEGVVGVKVPGQEIRLEVANLS